MDSVDAGSQLKVTIIAGAMPPMPCGVGAYTSHFVRHLARHVSVDVVQLRRTDSAGVGTVFWVDRWGPYGVFRAVRHVRTTAPDVVCLQYPTLGFRWSVAINGMGFLLRAVRGGPALVVTLHEQAASPMVGVVRNYLTCLPADWIVVSNGRDQSALQSRLRRKSSVIPIPANVDKVDAVADEQDATAARFGVPVEIPLVVFFGFPFQAKRIEVLLDAVERVAGLNCLLITKFDARRSYDRRILRLVSEINRRVPGKVTVASGTSDREASLLLRLGRYIVLPERYPLTGKSGSTVAGVRHGLIPIGSAASNCGDNLPYVHHVNSVLIPELDGPRLASALRELESDSVLRERIAAGVMGLSRRLEWDDVVLEHLAIYRRVARHEGS